MSKSEKRIRSNKLRRQKERRKNIMLSIMTICLVVTLSFTINGFLSNAKSGTDGVEFKYYKSIIVDQGDTLWSIATENMNERYDNTAELVKEIMQMNGLTDDGITAGSYLVVPYYSAEFVS